MHRPKGAVEPKRRPRLGVELWLVVPPCCGHEARSFPLVVGERLPRTPTLRRPDVLVRAAAASKCVLSGYFRLCCSFWCSGALVFTAAQVDASLRGSTYTGSSSSYARRHQSRERASADLGIIWGFMCWSSWGQRELVSKKMMHNAEHVSTAAEQRLRSVPSSPPPHRHEREKLRAAAAPEGESENSGGASGAKGPPAGSAGASPSGERRGSWLTGRKPAARAELGRWRRAAAQASQHERGRSRPPRVWACAASRAAEKAPSYTRRSHSRSPGGLSRRRSANGALAAVESVPTAAGGELNFPPAARWAPAALRRSLRRRVPTSPTRRRTGAARRARSAKPAL